MSKCVGVRVFVCMGAGLTSMPTVTASQLLFIADNEWSYCKNRHFETLSYQNIHIFYVMKAVSEEFR